jgi:lipopolysaccharide transport system ATP-binding protein
LSHTAIRVRNLGKEYQLGTREPGYATFRDAITNFVKAPFERFRQLSGRTSADESFWALKNVSFDIQEGEVVGIIGRNGAGKSTLLKILSQITEPTTGEIELHGRVGSLLEVGTGFHPELTGRENIYLNGAILGMKRAEITRRFDEIVAFAEIEAFLDTPAKRYSSGMYMRLAFAVAAHLEPEILVVDEVLAVGDAVFQRKCLGKMGEVAKRGRTVLFVSHNMNAVEQLCTSALWLDKGCTVMRSADVAQVVKDYLRGAFATEDTSEWEAGTASKTNENPYFAPLRFGVYYADGRPVRQTVSKKDEVWVEIEASIQMTDPALTIGYALFSENGNLIYWSYHTDTAEHQWPCLSKGTIILRSQLPTFLNEGVYHLELICSLHCRKWLFEPGSGVPTIALSIAGGISDSPYWLWKRPGELGPIIQWYLK